MGNGAQIDHRFAERFGTLEQAERYRDRYARGRRARVHQREAAALKGLLSRVPPSEFALDLPCGTGRLAPLLAGSANGIILADKATCMLRLAHEDHRGPKSHFLQIGAEQIALLDGAVDIVLCHRLLNHVHDPALRSTMLAELARVSRKYVIVSFFPSSLRSRVRGWLRRVTRIGRRRHGPATMRAFFAEADAAGLQPIHSASIRKFPQAFFCLFQKVSRYT